MSNQALHDHLATGVTGLCRLWLVTRRDGVTLGFTDHDGDLTFGGQLYRAGTGLTARALQRSSGLSVDNTEALGALQDAAITEADLQAGRYDGAAVRIWLARWAAPDVRAQLFQGWLGEVSRQGQAFQAELRGMAEPLNRQIGDVYAKGCAAVLGDGRCRFDTAQPGYMAEVVLGRIEPGQRVLSLDGLAGFADRWFEAGRLEVLDGAAAGLVSAIRGDRLLEGGRRIDLWQAPRAALQVGDRVRLVAGCDKRADTCREKFGNFMNFRGFPHLPGEDWLTLFPGAT